MGAPSQAGFQETRLRSATKAITWRVVGTAVTAVVTFLATHRAILSVAVGATDFVLKIGLFWLHERAWNRVAFGKSALRPAVIWLTARASNTADRAATSVHATLIADGARAELLDADMANGIVSDSDLSEVSSDDRDARFGRLVATLERNGVFVVTSSATGRAGAQTARRMCSNFIEVSLDAGVPTRSAVGSIECSDSCGNVDTPAFTVDTANLSVQEVGRTVIDLVATRMRAISVTNRTVIAL
jgi:adenylylsulfate kinase